jgi:hypothetical protein
MNIFKKYKTDLTSLLMAYPSEKKLKKMPPHEKILLPPHIAHICFCQLTHKPTQRQNQKSAIANALQIPFSNFINYTIAILTFETIINSLKSITT